MELIARHCPHVLSLTFDNTRDFSDADMIAFWAEAKKTVATVTVAATSATTTTTTVATTTTSASSPMTTPVPSSVAHALSSIPAPANTNSTLTSFAPATTMNGFHTFSMVRHDFSTRPFKTKHRSPNGGKHSYTTLSFTSIGLSTLLEHAGRTLTHLNFTGCVSLTDTDLESIAKHTNSTLQLLDVAYCDFEGSGLQSVLRQCQHLTHLGVGMTKIRNERVEQNFPLWIGAWMGTRAQALCVSGWQIGVLLSFVPSRPETT
jgi:hypothetical protein